MSPGSVAQLRVFDTPEDLARDVAGWIVERARAKNGDFALCLSGGTTPERLYQLLGAAPLRDRFPFERTHWFWGDERFVPADDPRSNFRMAWQALLQHVPVPPGNIHAIATAHPDPAASAAAYEAVLTRYYGADTLDPQRPLFDLTLLGLGEDGHIASLFPQGAPLAEQRHWVVAAVGATPPDRITLTLPALASSRATALLVAGERKRAALARFRAGDPALPATQLRPQGEFFCFADRAAAAAVPAFSED